MEIGIVDGVEITDYRQYNINFLLRCQDYGKIATLLKGAYFSGDPAARIKQAVEDVVSTTSKSDLRDSYLVNLGTSGSFVAWCIDNLDEFYDADLEKIIDLGKQASHGRNGMGNYHAQLFQTTQIPLQNRGFIEWPQGFSLEWNKRKGRFVRIQLRPMDSVNISEERGHVRELWTEAGIPHNCMEISLTKRKEKYEVRLSKLFWNQRGFLEEAIASAQRAK